MKNMENKFKVKFIIEKEDTIIADSYKNAKTKFANKFSKPQKESFTFFIKNLQTGDKHICNNGSWITIKKIKIKKIPKEPTLIISDLRRVLSSGMCNNLKGTDGLRARFK